MVSGLHSPLSFRSALSVVPNVGDAGRPQSTFTVYNSVDNPVMLDFLLLRAPLANIRTDSQGCPIDLTDDELAALGSKLCCTLERDGRSNVGVPWESVDSGHGSLAVKVFRAHPQKCGGFPYVEIKCSPAKLVQGHNIYWHSNLTEAARILLQAFLTQMPELAQHVDWPLWEVLRIDVNAPSWVKSDSKIKPDGKALQYLNALKSVSNGHRKAISDDAIEQDDASSSLVTYRGSVYWNHSSDLIRAKVYLKGPEFRKYLRDLQRCNPARFNELFPTVLSALLTQVDGMVRWEAQVMKKFLKRRGIPTLLSEICQMFNEGAFTLFDFWVHAFRPIFEAFKGADMTFAKMNDDEKVRAIVTAGTAPKPRRESKRFFNDIERARLLQKFRLAGIEVRSVEMLGEACGLIHIERMTQSVQCGTAAARTYQLIKETGFDTVKSSMPRQTWLRHLHVIKSAGVSLAQLQQFNGTNTRPVVIPLIQMIPAVFQFDIAEKRAC